MAIQGLSFKFIFFFKRHLLNFIEMAHIWVETLDLWSRMRPIFQLPTTAHFG